MIGLGFKIPIPVESLHAEHGEDLKLRMALGIREVLRTVEGTARALAPVRTGRLRNSIRAYLTGTGAGVLVASVPYAAYLHRGTGIYGPHRRGFHIKPRSKKALWWPGAAHPVRAVYQKGIRPRDFLRLAVSDALIARAFNEGFESGRFA